MTKFPKVETFHEIANDNSQKFTISLEYLLCCVQQIESDLSTEQLELYYDWVTAHRLYDGHFSVLDDDTEMSFCNISGQYTLCCTIYWDCIV